jgi:tetratricopeptide (TPR) repeat protein
MKTSLRACALLLIVILLAPVTGCDTHPGKLAQTQRRSGFTIPELRPRASGLGDLEFAKVRRKYDELKEKIGNDGMNPEPYVELAQLFLQEARITGRHHEYIPEARAALDQALLVSPGNFDATITKASMEMTLHQFQEAKKLALQAIERNSHSAFAYGVLCDANVELGEYDEAVRASDRMLAIRPDLRSYARASYLREIHGDPKGAIDAMKMAVDAGAPGMEDRSWALYNLGTLFLNQGKPDTAAYLFNGILEERPNYPYALSGLAAVRSAKGDDQGAIELLVKATRLSPEHLFVEQLSDIYRAIGSKAEAETMEKKALDAYEAHEKGGWNIDREYAAYCGNHDINLTEALARARRDYERRPGNIDANDTYAWLLYKNGRAADAIPYAEAAIRLKTEHPMAHYHAGMIYYAAGRTAPAIRELRHAMTSSPSMSALCIADAKRALASMGIASR